MTLMSDVPVDEIKLSDPELWQQPDDVRDAVFGEAPSREPDLVPARARVRATDPAGARLLGRSRVTTTSGR